MREVEVALDVRASLGECPRWDENDQRLYWVDINAGQLHSFDPATGRDEFLQFDEEVGCFALREQGGFVLAMRSGFFLLDDWNTELITVSDPEFHLPHNRFNDGRCDASSRFVAGSYYPPKDYDGANIWTLGTNLSVTKLREGLLTSNGIAWSPDNKTFYYSDTPKHRIYASDYDLETGAATNTRIFREFPQGEGRPDGATVDAEGCYWTALYEGSRVVRLSPEGEIVEEVPLPARCPTMVAMGGEDMQTLYITTAGGRPEEELQEYPRSGAIFQVRVDVPGLPEHRFGA